MKTHHILQKNKNKTKTTETKSQKHKMIHSTVYYSDSYKQMHTTLPKNHTNTKITTLTIK